MDNDPKTTKEWTLEAIGALTRPANWAATKRRLAAAPLEALPPQNAEDVVAPVTDLHRRALDYYAPEQAE